MIHMLDTDSFVLLLRGTSIKRADSPRKVAVKASAARILARANCHPLARFSLAA